MDSLSRNEKSYVTIDEASTEVLYLLKASSSGVASVALARSWLAIAG